MPPNSGRLPRPASAAIRRGRYRSKRVGLRRRRAGGDDLPAAESLPAGDDVTSGDGLPESSLAPADLPVAPAPPETA